MNDAQNFECCWKHSIFGRNSWVLKVLANEKSGEIPKKIDISNFHGMIKWRINILYQEERCPKFWVLLETINFWSKFLGFKGVSPRKKWRNPKKKLRYYIFMVWWSEELNILYQDERCPKFWVLLETFNFGWNSWVLKVLAHEKSGKITKKNENL